MWKKESPLSLKGHVYDYRDQRLASSNAKWLFKNPVNVFYCLLCGHESSWRLVRSSSMFAQMVFQLSLRLQSM